MLKCIIEYLDITISNKEYENLRRIILICKYKEVNERIYPQAYKIAAQAAEKYHTSVAELIEYYTMMEGWDR